MITAADKIYCINLERRPDRWGMARLQFEKHGLQVERFPAIDGQEFKKQYSSDAANCGCTLSHYQVIERAFFLGLNSIIVFEDDAVLHGNFQQLLEICLQDLPADADVLYFGGSHREAPVPITENIYQVKRTLATHGYFMRSSIFPRIMSELKQLDQPVDCIFHKLQKELQSFYITNPPLAWQRKDYSDIVGRVMHYPWQQTNNQ